MLVAKSVENYKKLAIKKELKQLKFSHVEIGQTPEERVAVIKVTTHQGINSQDSSLISQVLSNLLRPQI